MTQYKLRIGILGTANVARRFVASVNESQEVEIVAIASRDSNKAKVFAEQFNIERACGSYNQLLSDPQVEAVYVPLPNSLHFEWVVSAIDAGKHVLCEKPLATRARDANAMFASAQARGVTLVEGYPYLSQPHLHALKQLISGGAIGEIRSIQATIGFTVVDPDNIRLDPTLSGGGLLDAGTYPVSLIRVLFGRRPKRVYAVAKWNAQGVDESVHATLEHDGDLVAHVSCNLAVGLHRHAIIVGSTGTVQTTFLNNPPLDKPVVLQLRRGQSDTAAYESIEVPPVNGFRAEAESFARLIKHGPDHWTGVTPQESIDIALTLESIIRSARSNTPIDVLA